VSSMLVVYRVYKCDDDYSNGDSHLKLGTRTTCRDRPSFSRESITLTRYGICSVVHAVCPPGTAHCS